MPPPDAWFKELVRLGYEALGEALRDYLRRSPQAARQYAAAKQAAVAAGATTPETYSRAKSEIVVELLAKALKRDDLA